MGRTTSGSCGATDQAKNRASCTESITVVDTTAPSVTAALTVTTSGRKHDGDDDGRKNLFPVRCAATDTYDPAPSVQAFVPLGDISACRIVLHKDLALDRFAELRVVPSVVLGARAGRDTVRAPA